MVTILVGSRGVAALSLCSGEWLHIRAGIFAVVLGQAGMHTTEAGCVVYFAETLPTLSVSVDCFFSDIHICKSPAFRPSFVGSFVLRRSGCLPEDCGVNLATDRLPTGLITKVSFVNCGPTQPSTESETGNS
jgi:hypothetical protein